MGIFSRMAELADRIDRFNAAIGRTAAWAALFIVLMQFAVVVLRYAFGIGSIWLSESIVYGHASLFMLAAAWTLRENGHVRVDVFYAEDSARTKALIDLVGALVLLIPFMLVLATFAVPYVARSWAILERSRETSGLPLVFLLKTLIPAFAVLFALQGVSQAIRAGQVLCSRSVTPGLDPGVHPSSPDGLPGQARQ
jgi:TRAP-type mannitol/chloroaromatic compound transport system permease small subunit